MRDSEIKHAERLLEWQRQQIPVCVDCGSNIPLEERCVAGLCFACVKKRHRGVKTGLQKER